MLSRSATVGLLFVSILLACDLAMPLDKAKQLGYTWNQHRYLTTGSDAVSRYTRPGEAAIGAPGQRAGISPVAFVGALAPRTPSEGA